MRLIDADVLKELFSEVIGHITKKPEMNGNLEHMIRASAMVIQMIDDAPTVQSDTTTHDSNVVKKGGNDEDRTSGDCISRRQAIDKFIDGLEEIFSDIREREVDDSVCGLCEYDGAYIGQSGDWCNECPGFDRDDCFKLSDKTRKKWTDEIIKAFPSVQPETNCSEIPNNWIPCSERQPNVNGWYITTISGEICGQDRAFSGMSEFANGKWTSGDDADETEMTIAWCPLPEPYQGGEQK